MGVLGLLIPQSFFSEGCPDAFLLGAVSCEMSWLITVETVPGGGTVLHRIIPVLPPPLTSVPLGSTQVHWDCHVVEGLGGV